LAALSIGGVGIWVMHFIAMLGFETPGMPVRYDIARTVLSAIISIGAVYLGLIVVRVHARFVWWRLLLGGVITGLAVNFMHYTGMWALQIKGSFGYNGAFVALSVFIAVVAATAALWFAVALDKLLPRVIAGLVMAAAVTGMHYTGMAAVQMNMDMAAPDPSGTEVFSFLFPVFVLAALGMAVPICAVLMASAPGEDKAADTRAEVPAETASVGAHRD
ncbi:MAG: hypothetical protein QOI21_2095, partial [Actinomycetota bacterium]|nr:hypothetical protein [Actinomycetota bacterium]